MIVVRDILHFAILLILERKYSLGAEYQGKWNLPPEKWNEFPMKTTKEADSEIPLRTRLQQPHFLRGIILITSEMSLF